MQVTLLTRPHVDGTEKEFKLLRQKLSVNPVQYQLCGKPLPMPKTAKAGGSQPPAAATSPASTAPSTAEAAPAADASTPLAALPLETKEGPDAGTNPVNTGYIKVATFSKQTTEAVKSAIKALQAQGATRYCTSSQFLSLSSLFSVSGTYSQFALSSGLLLSCLCAPLCPAKLQVPQGLAPRSCTSQQGPMGLLQLSLGRQ